jgi:hypothetical protein
MPTLISLNNLDENDKINKRIPFKHIHVERLQRENPKSVVKQILKQLKEQKKHS